MTKLSKPRRLAPLSVTADHTILDYDLGISMGMITVTRGWNVSYMTSSKEEGVTLNVFAVSGLDTGKPIEITPHPALDGLVFKTQNDAQRVAYNAGVLDLYYYIGS